MLAEPEICVQPPDPLPNTRQNNTRRAQVVKILGEGAFGEVKLVVDPRNPTCCVALKCIDLRKFQNNSEALNQFKKEAYLQRLVSTKECDNIIRYIGMRVESEDGLNELQIYLEYADGGELFDQIEPDVGMPPVKAQFYFRQLLRGLRHIHSMGVVHRDIKPENLLLTGQDVLKISDFGMATVFRHSGRERMLNATCGTLPYASPQVIGGFYKAEPVDIWSSGVVLVAMLAGELPWDSASRDCLAYQDWVDGQVVLTENNPWKKIDNSALSLIRAMLTEKEDLRATLQRVMEHPWTNADFVNNNESVSVPAIKRQKLSNDKEDCPAASQPSTFKCSAPGGSGYNSFSQPTESLLLSISQISQCSDIDPMAMMVRRMTRFCVTICGADLVTRIVSACVNLGFLPTEKANKTLLITYRDMSFVVTIYELPSKVLVDCRRSRGDGLEFKRAFLLLKASLTSIISKDGIFVHCEKVEERRNPEVDKVVQNFCTSALIHWVREVFSKTIQDISTTLVFNCGMSLIMKRCAALIDLNGTLHIEDMAIPNATEALERLRLIRPVKFVTNTTKESINVLHKRVTECGFHIRKDEIFTSLIAARRFVESHSLRPMLMLDKKAMEDFKDIDTSNPNAVVIGLAPSEFHFEKLNDAFKLVLNGARLVAVHKGRYYRRSDGLALGPGPFVAAIEYATSTEATVVGKPDSNFFLMSIATLGDDIDVANTVMIGDDVKDDVMGAIHSGMKAILVRTGKYRKGDEEQIPLARRNCVASFAEAVDLIESGKFKYPKPLPRHCIKHKRT
ncbi:HAD hydrolase family [Dictyocaulus viviparus]|uniref:Haloacid dehalogenase-like hydrolase domain-containing protein 2 n=1 Tax=Dictyocaulus viviparus TaxID=29172 RepID=A0A0D8Y826_DICVI|nr:HAD hydrolase family [Dictyocaulus viviparus]